MFNLPGCRVPYYRKLGLGRAHFLDGSSPSPAARTDTVRVSFPLVKHCFEAQARTGSHRVRQKYFYTIMMFAVT
jgi:hypothetical protein